jgi:hypothetical protein
MGACFSWAGVGLRRAMSPRAWPRRQSFASQYWLLAFAKKEPHKPIGFFWPDRLNRQGVIIFSFGFVLLFYFKFQMRRIQLATTYIHYRWRIHRRTRSAA